MKAKFYFSQVGDAEVDVIDALESAGVAKPYTALVVDVERADVADAFGRLMAAMGQEFDLVYEDDVDKHLVEQIAEALGAWSGPAMPAVAVEAVLPKVEAQQGEQAAVCEHCRQPFAQKRKNIRFCDKPECQEAKKRDKMARAKESAQREKAEAVAEAGIAPAAEHHEEAAGPAGSRAGHDQDYEIRSGERTGARLSRYQLETALKYNEMQVGQVLYCGKNETWFKVVQGDKTQKIARTQAIALASSVGS